MEHTDRHFANLDPSATSPSPFLFERARTACMAMAFLGAVGVIIGWPMNPAQFYHSYLTSWSFCWTTMMGVLFFVMIHHMVDAGWSTVIRRPAEQVLSAMPVLLLLSLPIIVGMFTGQLQHWIHLPQGADPILDHKRWFLNVPFLVIRLCIYAVAFLWLAYVLRRNSIHQDFDGASAWTISSRRWSTGGMVLYALTLSFCAFDLLMALDHHWFSTVFGVYTWIGGVVGGLCLITLICLPLREGPLRQYIGSDHVHDLGKLVFAFSVFWAYIAFSQYFLVWYANIPEETIYFLRRWTGETEAGGAIWWIVSVLVAVGRFVLPFFILMSAHTKRNPKILTIMCVVLLAAHWLDQYWMVQPEISTLRPPVEYIWMDISALLLIAGACGMVLIRSLRRASLVPIMDPRLVEALSAEHVEEIEHADQD